MKLFRVIETNSNGGEIITDFNDFYSATEFLNHCYFFKSDDDFSFSIINSSNFSEADNDNINP